ncbi:MAG: CNNM domain-containing protein [Psychrobium sp.]
MILLSIYLFIALFFSFICSIAESVILSVSQGQVALLEKEGRPSGKILAKLKQDLDKPLAAILTLNTVAHTVGAAGVGAQAAAVFGESYLGVISAVLTILILFISEIIPKTLGATYAKELAPVTAHVLRYMIMVLNPIIVICELVTKYLVRHKPQFDFSRDEFTAMAEIGEKQGTIDSHEAQILQNLMMLQDLKIKSAMTPSTVIFSDEINTTVEAFFLEHQKVRFSRIPVYEKSSHDIVGFVLRSDLLLAQARGNTDTTIGNYLREMPTLLETMTLSHAMRELLSKKDHMALIVNEYGTVRGVITLEDILETLIGREIIDEGDKDIDMQKLAKKLWKAKAQKLGVDENVINPDSEDKPS